MTPGSVLLVIQHQLHECVTNIAQGERGVERFAELIRVLAMLWQRGAEDAATHAYCQMAFSGDELAASPINLSSFHDRGHRWHALPLNQVLQDLVAWCMNTHLTVALRKLRQTGQSTFRFRPTELGLQLVDQIPMPAATTPRIKQVLHILLDLGALQRVNEDVGYGMRLTNLGRQCMETASV